MAIITESELRSIVRDPRVVMYSESRQYDIDDRQTIFLSHEHTDIKYIVYLENLLKSLNVNLYIDWLDEKMPDHTNRETAQRIKEKIRENDKFILLATEDAINSKWCNWELGFADNEKSQQDSLVLFPVKKDYKDWSGSEYMQLYPVIESSRYRRYVVKYPTGNEILLEKWLSNE